MLNEIVPLPVVPPKEERNAATFKNQKNWSVYTLEDPFTGKVRYVGCSKYPALRFAQHLTKPSSKKVKNWVQMLREANQQPIFRIIESVDETNATEREEYWIKHYEDEGLLNVESGNYNVVSPLHYERKEDDTELDEVVSEIFLKYRTRKKNTRKLLDGIAQIIGEMSKNPYAIEKFPRFIREKLKPCGFCGKLFYINLSTKEHCGSVCQIAAWRWEKNVVKKHNKKSLLKIAK
jgi:predicted GIY-YIG superfamily endonuclease